MRTVSAELATWLDTHTAGVIRHLVTITPRGGSPVYWTDHTADITIGGNTFLAGGANGVPVITWGKRTEVAGTEIGSLEMVLGCGSSATFGGVRLPKAAADRAFDGAVVKVERLFGESNVDTSLGAMHLFEGLVAEARPNSTAVELEIESGLAALNVEIPRKLFRPGCTNILFDTQCGLVKASFTVAGTVGAASTATVIRSNRTEASGYFDLGVLTFNANTTTVALRGVVRAVRSYANTNGAFTLDRPLPTTPATGDTFTVYPGCPRTLAACESKFGTDNRVHFRAFPFMPRDGASADGLAVKAIKHLVGSREEFEKDSQDPVPVLYGKRRIRGRLIYQGERVAERVPVQFALCEGEIAGVYTRYAGNSGAVIDAFTGNSTVSIATGTRPTQAAWTTLPAGRDLGYPGVAIVSFMSSLENGLVPAHEWEVGGRLYNTLGSDGDADPGQVVADLLPNADFGAGFPFDIVTDAGLDEDYPSESSCAAYVAAAGFGVSLFLDQRRAALDVLGEFCESINCEPLWSGGKLKIIPRADTAVGSFAPCTKIRYSLNANALIGSGDEDPVRVRLDPETETFNSCPVVFSERAPAGVSTDPGLAYQDTTEQDPDPVDVALRGERPAADVRFPAICRRDHALRISRILAQRQVRTRQEVEFSVAWPFGRLEPLDLITIADDLFPYASQPFQIREVSEDMNSHVLTITAQEWTAGVNFSATHTTQSSDGGSTTWPPGENEEWLGTIDDRGVNLFPNPTSEISPKWPTLSGPAWEARYEAGAGAYSGSWVRRVVAMFASKTLASPFVACIPGSTFRLRCQAKYVSGVGGSISINLTAYEQDRETVAASVDSGAITATTWGQHTVELLIPGGATCVRAGLTTTPNAPTTATGDFDAIQFSLFKSDPDSLAASLSDTTRSGSCTRATAVPCTATSNAVTVTPSGGVPPYTYAWSRVSGDTLTVTSPTSASTTFSTTATPPTSFVGVYKCTVTDYNGTTADTGNVTTTTEHILSG